jgi:hypothetical protein
MRPQTARADKCLRTRQPYTAESYPVKRKESTMPDNRTTACEQAAQTTIDLLEFKQTPAVLSDAILETLIEMSAESRANIWHKETGISVATLAALYSMYAGGAGYRRMTLRRVRGRTLVSSASQK